MSDVVIRAEGLGKIYLIGHEAEQGSYVTLRETVQRNIGRLKRSVSDIVNGRPLIIGEEVEEFWALKDVNFEIPRGEVVGIIGRNGAGKSTLLKVLSRITEPTEGRVTIEGRVASLLEVGTGFHPELSGRENVFLNGSILGMTRKEIQSKFEEIVDFAGVKKFIDTPVKRYSSGMKVRLGFSVAAHLEPEILIVDEVLAVGDAEFQKKCIGKMQDVAGSGRTVLFVSHNMSAISTLCSRAILLSKGQKHYDGATSEAIAAYLKSSDAKETEYFCKEDIGPRILRAKIESITESTSRNIISSRGARITFLLSKDAVQYNIGVVIKNSQGIEVAHFSDEFSKTAISNFTERFCEIPAGYLRSDDYFLSASLFNRNVSIIESLHEILKFSVIGDGAVYERTTGSWRGISEPNFLCWGGVKNET